MRAIDDGFVVDGVNPSDQIWPLVEDNVLEKFVEEKALNDIWVFKNLYPKIVARLVETNGVNQVEYIVSLDYKKYRFAYEKRQSIWFRVLFQELK